MEITWRVISGEGAGGRVGEQVQAIRSINGRYKIDRGRLRIVWEIGESKELTCTTHGHEPMWGNDGGRGDTGWPGIKGRKNGTTVIA